MKKFWAKFQLNFKNGVIKKYWENFGKILKIFLKKSEDNCSEDFRKTGNIWKKSEENFEKIQRKCSLKIF